MYFLYTLLNKHFEDHPFSVAYLYLNAAETDSKFSAVWGRHFRKYFFFFLVANAAYKIIHSLYVHNCLCDNFVELLTE